MFKRFKLRQKDSWSKFDLVVIRFRLMFGFFMPVDVRVSYHVIYPYGMRINGITPGQTQIAFGLGKWTTYWSQLALSHKYTQLGHFLIDNDIHECYISMRPGLIVPPSCDVPLEDIIDAWLSAYHLKKGKVTDIRRSALVA